MHRGATFVGMEPVITPPRLLWALRRLAGPPHGGRLRLIDLLAVLDDAPDDIPPLVASLETLGLVRRDGGWLAVTPQGETLAYGDFRGFAVWIDSAGPAVLDDTAFPQAGARDDSAADRCRPPACPDALPRADHGDGPQGGAAPGLARAARA